MYILHYYCLTLLSCTCLLKVSLVMRYMRPGFIFSLPMPGVKKAKIIGTSTQSPMSGIDMNVVDCNDLSKVKQAKSILMNFSFV